MSLSEIFLNVGDVYGSPRRRNIVVKEYRSSSAMLPMIGPRAVTALSSLHRTTQTTLGLGPAFSSGGNMTFNAVPLHVNEISTADIVIVYV